MEKLNLMESGSQSENYQKMKERLAFYDKLFVEAYLRKIKIELIVLNPEFLIASKKQIVTHNQVLLTLQHIG